MLQRDLLDVFWFEIPSVHGGYSFVNNIENREKNFCLEEEKSRFFVGEDIILPHIKFQIGIKRFHIPKYTFLQNRNTNFLCIRGRMISSPTNLRSLNLVNPHLSYGKINAAVLSKIHLGFSA